MVQTRYLHAVHEHSPMRTRYAFVLLLSALWSNTRADHFAGGSITARCTGNNRHDITLQLLRSCDGLPFAPQIIDFKNSCGVTFNRTGIPVTSIQEVSGLCAADLPNSTCNGGTLPGFELVTYQLSGVYLSPCERWVISWNYCCRSEYLVNVPNGPALYIETTVHNANGACNTPPEFSDNTVPIVCQGQAVSYNGGATASDGHTLRYALIDARRFIGYVEPVPYAVGYSGATPIQGMTIDPATGMITLTPTITGAFVVVVEVTETGSTGNVIGTIMRDFLFVVTNCLNSVPSSESGTFTHASDHAVITGGRELSVCGPEPFCASITVADANIDQRLTLTSSLFSTLPGATLVVTGNNPISANLCWAAAAPGVYTFSITATDDACPMPGSQAYRYTITVTAPPDAGEDASISTCENGLAFAMIDHLGGTPQADGQWTDPQGEPSDGLFVPGTSPAGTHTYTVGSASCSASAELSVAIEPSTAPECLAAGVAGPQSRDHWLRPDAYDTHRYWISAPASNATLTIISADGRFLHRARFTSNTEATLIEVPSTHHGLTFFQLQEASGTRHVMRTVVP